MKVINLTRNTVIANDVKIAKSFFTRFKGLLGRKSLGKDEALILTNCNSIHMFFMRFSIDLIFVDKKNCVVELIKNIKPWAITPIYHKANFAIELSLGAIENSHTQLGDKLQII